MHSKLYYRIKDMFLRIGKKWDAMTPEKDNAIEFAHKYLNNDPPKMDSEVRYSSEYVLAHNGEMINAMYRRDSHMTEDYQIPQMLEKYTTKETIVVYRGVIDEVYKQMVKNARGHKGVDLFEKAFLSTSLVKGCEIPRHRRLRILIPAGTKAVYQGNVNDEQEYFEVDIQHNAELKVVSMDKTYINCILLKTA